MTCKEAINQLYEFLDNELDDYNCSKIKKHLDICQKCCEKFEFEQTLKKIVRDRTRIHRVPQYVRENILKQLSETHEERTRVKPSILKLGKQNIRDIFGFFTLRPIYINTAVLILLIISGLTAYYVYFKPVDSSPIIKGAAECHDRFIKGKMLLDLVSSDRNEIRRYLNASKQVNVDMAIPVFKGIKIKHLGCKNCYLAGRKSAHIEMERRHNKISLEVIDSSGMNINSLKRQIINGRQYYFGRHKGYNVVLWRYGKKMYSLTSTMPRKELVHVANGAIRSHHE
ncbi:MAG: mycothiol system anti-sigma-R factor [Candidatus Scalinduaceae bacterium]